MGFMKCIFAALGAWIHGGHFFSPCCRSWYSSAKTLAFKVPQPQRSPGSDHLFEPGAPGSIHRLVGGSGSLFAGSGCLGFGFFDQLIVILPHFITQFSAHLFHKANHAFWIIFIQIAPFRWIRQTLEPALLRADSSKTGHDPPQFLTPAVIAGRRKLLVQENQKAIFSATLLTDIFVDWHRSNSSTKSCMDALCSTSVINITKKRSKCNRNDGHAW